ncbi:MAG: hypothetical protein IJY47_03710 [Clostridia bacterium]|nr:hypothetical protein [Clostridia bacterium]
MKQHLERTHQSDQEWIVQCEEHFSRNLESIANEICAKKNNHMLRLAGPTCSGKTTASNMLSQRFAALGRRLHIVSIDDFYLDNEVLRANSLKKGTGKIDYDSAETIDWEELRSFTKEIMNCDKSECPIFDFKQGKRIGYRSMESGPEDVFLFEGIQVLYPEANEIFESCAEEVVGIYIAPQSSIAVGNEIIEPNELRLLRRLVRDVNFRNTPPERTFALWDGVRSNEDAHIFPYVDVCTYRIDSTMPYELGILKPYLKRFLTMVSKQSPYFAHAQYILAMLEPVAEISDQLILPGSLYKEFI